MKRDWSLILMGLFLFIFITGCNNESAATIVQMSVADIPEKMSVSEDAEDGAVYIDVREPFEYDNAYIEGFENYPLSSLEETYTQLPKGKEIVIICRSGNRSMEAAALLQEKGFERITNVQGAMVEWDGETKSNN